MSDEKQALYSSLIAKIFEIKLAGILGKNPSLEFKENTDSSLVDGKITCQEDSYLAITALEAIDSSLVIEVSNQNLITLADIFAGGDGSNEAELSPELQASYLDKLVELTEAVLKYLAFKNDELQLQYGTANSAEAAAGEETELSLHGSLEAVALNFSLAVDNANVAITVHVDKTHLDNFITKLEEVFPELDIEAIAEQLEEELNQASAEGSLNAGLGGADLSGDGVIEDPFYKIDEKRNLNFISGVNLDLIVELGRAEMLFDDVLRLTKGSAIGLDRHCSEPVDLYVHNQLIARGEVIAIDDNFGLKITEVVGPINIFKDLSQVVV